MPTGTPGVAARQDPRQLVNTLKKIVNWNDPGILTGLQFANYLPQNAFILSVQTEVVIAFNGTSPVLTAGTVGAAYNNLVSAADITEATPAVYPSLGGLGRSLTAAGPVLPFALLAVTGSPSTGQAIIVITYEGGWDS